MTDTSYEFRLLRDECGPFIEVEYWAHPIPNPAVLSVTAPGIREALKLTLESTPTELPRLVALEVHAERAGGKITSNDLRRIKVGEVTAYAIRFLGWYDSISQGAFPDTTFAQFERSGSDLPMWQRQDMLESWTPTRNLMLKVHPDVRAKIDVGGPRSDFTTRTVGALYLEAERMGQPPNKWIADGLQISAATASNWIKYARDAGTVPPSVRKSRKDKENA